MKNLVRKLRQSIFGLNIQELKEQIHHSRKMFVVECATEWMRKNSDGQVSKKPYKNPYMCLDFEAKDDVFLPLIMDFDFENLSEEDIQRVILFMTSFSYNTFFIRTKKGVHSISRDLYSIEEIEKIFEQVHDLNIGLDERLYEFITRKFEAGTRNMSTRVSCKYDHPDMQILSPYYGDKDELHIQLIVKLMQSYNALI